LSSPEHSSPLCFGPNGVPAVGTPTASSSLDTLETNQQRAGLYIKTSSFGSCEHDTEAITEEESTFRHSGWAVRRAQIWNSFTRCNVTARRTDRFANCGSGLWLQKNEDATELHLSCNKCHDRWCIPCQNERAALIREKIAQHLSNRHVRMMTLTLRASQTPLRDQIARLYRSLTNFRRRESWKAHVTGGCAFLEAKIGEQSGLWHVHLHLLLEGSFWDQREISHEWHCVTGDSSIVHIGRRGDRESMAHYVTKYVTKPADSSVYAVNAMLDELMIAMRGVRLALPFGTWRHLRLSEKPKCDVKWISINSVDYLRSMARDGDPEAIRWLAAASRKWPLFKQTFIDARPP
jgi:hypothetical protein